MGSSRSYHYAVDDEHVVEDLNIQYKSKNKEISD